MSGRACSYVGRLCAADGCTLRPTTRLVAFVVADFANEHALAWPSVATIARRVGITPANVRRALAELLDAGVLAVERGGGRAANIYRFPVEGLSTPRAVPRVLGAADLARYRASPRAVPREPSRGTARPTGKEQNEEHDVVDRPDFGGLTARAWAAAQVRR